MELLSQRSDTWTPGASTEACYLQRSASSWKVGSVGPIDRLGPWGVAVVFFRVAYGFL